MKPVQCIMGRPMERNNKQGQAASPESQRTAFQGSSSPALGAGARQVAEQHEAAAVAHGRNGVGLYCPVNSGDEPAMPAVEGPRGDDAPEGPGLYFPVNSRDEIAGAAPPEPPSSSGCSKNERGARELADRSRFPRLHRPTRSRHCKMLQIVADAHTAVVGHIAGTQAPWRAKRRQLPRYIALHNFMPQRPQSVHYLTRRCAETLGLSVA
jgi:hypothetical protein